MPCPGSPGSISGRHPLVVQVLAGAKRKLACGTTKEEAITPEILASLVYRFGGHEASLSDVHFYHLNTVN